MPFDKPNVVARGTKNTTQAKELGNQVDERQRGFWSQFFSPRVGDLGLGHIPTEGTPQGNSGSRASSSPSWSDTLPFSTGPVLSLMLSSSFPSYNSCFTDTLEVTFFFFLGFGLG